ncbi:MAG: ABC transporter permease [Pseudomonadota bacterium]
MTALKIGVFIIVMLVLAALVSTIWTPHDITQFNIPGRFASPSLEHFLGTDQYGRDVLSMLMEGARTALSVAIFAVAIGLVIGVPLGLLAAARGGWLDLVIMRGNDIIFAFPAILLAILFTAVAGPGTMNAVLAVGIFNIPVFAQLSRGAARSLWQRDFVMAAKAMGRSDFAISMDHIVPNLLSLLAIQASVQTSLGVAAEAALSYIGLGAQPPVASWGRMLSEAQTLFGYSPALMVWPGLAIVLAVFGFNLLGDGLRSVLDPREAA